MQSLNLTTAHSDHPSSGAMKEKHVLGQPPALADRSPDLYPTVPDDGCVELLWENGQIVMQGLSSNRTNQAQEVPTASVRAQGKELEQTKITAKQEDEMDLRLDYPIDDFYWEFLHDVSGIDLSSLSPPTPTDRIPSYGQVERDAAGTHASEDAGTSRSVIPTGYLQPNTSQLQQHCQTFTSSGSTPRDSDLRTGSSDQRPSNGGLPTKIQTQDPTSIKPIQPSSSAPLIMNFSHFTRLAAMVKSNLQFVDRMSGGSGAACTPSSGSATGSKLIESASEFRSVPAIFHGQATSVACNGNEPAQRAIQDSALFQHPYPICREQDATRINTSNYNNGTNSTRIPSHGSSFPSHAVAGKHGVEKPPKPPTVSTSMCSANGVGTSSNDDKNRAKWEFQEGDESKYQSEDFEDDSACTRKLIAGKSVSTKRSGGRAGVYNLSERRRRDRINERIRALRRLVPNCTKVDKASTLDEAIKYLKTLQMQLQVMSMCSGLHMMPMMGTQPIHPPHAGPLPPVGANMGMGMGFGMGMLDMTGSLPVPMVPVANMHGPYYPYGSLPVTTAELHGRMPGSANLRQVFGMPGQAQAAQLSMAMPHPPSFSPSMVNPTSQVPVAMTPQPAMDSAPPNSKNQQWIQPLLEPPGETSAARGRPQLATPRQA